MKRSRFTITALAIGLAFVSGFSAQAAEEAEAAVASARVAIAFTGTSTLHDFDGHAAEVKATLTAAPPTESAPDRRTWAGEVRVPVASLDTGSKRRDAGMRAMLSAERCPEIVGTLRGIDPNAVGREQRLGFSLRICEVEHELVAEIENWRQTPDHASFRAVFDVSLDAFSLEAPGILFMKVGDLVHVAVDVTVDRPVEDGPS